MSLRAYFLVALLLPLTVLAAPVACPLTLDEGAVKIVHPPVGWLGVSNSLARLTSGGVMRGHPDGEGYLRPQRITQLKGGGTSSNEFAAGEEKWLWCGYGGTNALQLAKRLPNEATMCTVRHSATKRDGITAISAECR